MRKIATAFKRTALGLLVLLQIFFYPAVAIAQEAPTDTSTTDPSTSSTSSTDPTTTGTPSDPTTTSDPSSSSTSSSDPTPPADTGPTSPTTGPSGPTGPTDPTGPTSPTGPTAPTGDSGGTYTYNPATGLWENAYYTWNPVTHQTAPKTPQNYSYNPSTGMWDTVQWRYDAPSGKYVPNIVSVALKPNDPLIANTGPNSANNIGVTNNNNATFNLFYDSRISNTINSTSRSGDASVLQNTSGGSALSGDAQGIVNLLNLLQSSWNPDATFTANINGNVTGDLLLDPNQIINSGPNSQNGIQRVDNNNLNVNAQVNGQIVNDVNLGVRSGNATVSDNTTGGDAQSGKADALVNIINMINSAVSSDKSFLGVININGNLDGDILLPQNLVAQIDTTGPNSLNTINQNGNTTTNTTAVDNKSITNNLDLSAASGNANVNGNTNAGSAQTGGAQTKINVYNLTGRDIIGDDALLVFVNVKGQWVGLIFNAPAGSNTVLGTGPNSTNTINSNTNNNANIDVNANSSIVNNVTADAQSGDAAVTNNTNGGNAKTGDASVTANIFNLIGSKLKLNGWFGVLFINVLGSWNGSFGINTAAGNALAATAAAGAASGNSGNGPFIVFVPKTLGSTSSSGGASNSNQSQQVIATNNTKSNPPTPKQPVKQPITSSQSSSNLVWIPVIGFAAGIGLLILEWLISLGQRIRVVWASKD